MAVARIVKDTIQNIPKPLRASFDKELEKFFISIYFFAGFE
jgi:Sec7-like guanine-nucleotide exchange factor